ncbi:MAG: FCD domain-containing protein [Anaerolineae bacterium]
MFSIQTMLMTLAADWLISERRLAEEDFAKAQSMIDKLQREVKDGALLSPLSVLTAEEAFKEYLLRKSGHSVLTRLWRQTVSQWWLLMNNYLRHENPAEIARRLISDQQKVLEALQNEDRDNLRAQIAAANERCCARVKEVLKSAGNGDS